MAISFPLKGAEVRIGGHDYPLLDLSPVHHDLIRSGLQSDLADVTRIVACRAQQLGQDR